MRRFAKYCALIATFVAMSCSLLVDLEPDCDLVSDCGAYACNDENTACRDRCSSDLHCGAGHGCALETGVCEFSGCEPLSQVAQPLEGVDPSYETFRAAPTLGGIALVLEHPRGIFLSRFRESSQGELALISDSADPELGAFVVYERDVPEGRERQFARVNLLDNGVSELGDNRLIFAWRIFDGRRFLMRSFRIERIDGPAGSDAGPRPRSQINFFSQRSGDLMGDLTLLPRQQGAAALWHEPSGSDSDRLLALALDGRLDDAGLPPVEVAERSVRDIRGVSAARVAGRNLIAFTGTDGSGRNQVVTRFYRDDNTLSPQPEVIRSAGTNRAEGVAIGPAGGAAWVLWTEGERLFSMGLDALGLPRRAGSAAEVSAGLVVRPSLGLRTAPRLSDYALTFAGARDEATGIWMARVDEEGVVGKPFLVQGELPVENVLAFDVVANSVDGFSVIWQSTEGDERRWWYRAYRCAL